MPWTDDELADLAEHEARVNAQIDALTADRDRYRDEATRLREQVRVLARIADPLCPDHSDTPTTGCDMCPGALTVRTIRRDLDGGERRG